MSDESKPREWQIYVRKDSRGIFYSSSKAYGPETDGLVHVIEYSAYEAVAKERDEYKNNAQEYSLKLLYTEQERDQLLEERKNLLEELERWKAKDELSAKY